MNNIVKTVVFAAVVLIAATIAVQFVMGDRSATTNESATSLSQISPAAGEVDGSEVMLYEQETVSEDSVAEGAEPYVEEGMDAPVSSGGWDGEETDGETVESSEGEAVDGSEPFEGMDDAVVDGVAVPSRGMEGAPEVVDEMAE
ncbi:MAG: hypothetical protein EOM26_08725 [Alphaproteobacteria bacterium]|nr:hypothetical protein [Alphaproteobacteria bacterium]